MPAKIKRMLIVAVPIWLIAVAFVVWGYGEISGPDPTPGIKPIWSGAMMVAGMTPLYVILEWLYEAGILTRPKPRPWVRKLTGSKDEDKKD